MVIPIRSRMTVRMKYRTLGPKDHRVRLSGVICGLVLNIRFWSLTWLTVSKMSPTQGTREIAVDMWNIAVDVWNIAGEMLNRAVDVLNIAGFYGYTFYITIVLERFITVLMHP